MVSIFNQDMDFILSGHGFYTVLICGLQAYSIHTKNSTEDLLKNVLDQDVDESKFDSKEKENEI